MLGKLIKHEFKANAKFFAIFFGAVLILSGVTKLFSVITDVIIKGTALENVFSSLTAVFYTLTVIALIFSSLAVVLFCAASYCKGLMGSEGYILFTLPVKPYLHILARVIVSTVYFLISLLVDGAAMFICGLFKYVSFKIIFGNAGIAGVNLGIVISAFFITVLIYQAYMFFVIFLSASIGAQFNNHHVLYSVVAYLIIDFIIQILGLITISIIVGTVSTDKINSFFYSIITSNPTAAVCGIMGTAVIIDALLSAVMFFINKYLVTKKLNLI